MTTIWLLLYLGGLVHALALYGFNTRHPGGKLLLLPILAIPVLNWLKSRKPQLFGPRALQLAGLAALGCGMTFLTQHVHRHWGTDLFLPALLVAGLGVASLWVTLGVRTREGLGAWIWVAAWMGTGALDPLLPLLGAGVAAFAVAGGMMPEGEKTETGQSMSTFLLPFLLGLALPKPWWDWGLQPNWAWPMLAFGLAAGLATLHRLQSARRWPDGLLLTGIGALAVLYDPRLGLLWGTLLGLFTGSAWRRLPRPLPLQPLAFALLFGLGLSFFLHANVWIPGLRHLVWLGN